VLIQDFGQSWQENKMASNLKERPRKNENPERFIKRFIKKCKKLGIIQEVRDRKQFVSKSERKRIAKRKAKRNNNKKKN
jgi:small subunit ribosomal protein S21